MTVEKLKWHVIDLAGWPWLCLCSESSRDFQANHFRQWTIAGIDLPLDPILSGLAADTAFYAGCWWMVFLSPGLIRRTVRRRRGQCVGCGYELKGIATNAPCPECGRARAG